jgi:hypothetical protein
MNPALPKNIEINNKYNIRKGWGANKKGRAG